MNTRIISRYLQLIRKSHNYTQEELAKKLDISRQAVSKWETGTTLPDVEVLLKISKLYGITINEILEPTVQAERISDFEQISEIPENELKEVLEQFDARFLVIASMGASPEINKLLERLFQNIDYKLLREQIGMVRITEVEAIQKEIVSMINLYVREQEFQSAQCNLQSGQ